MAARTRTEQRHPDEVPRSGVIMAGSRVAQRPSRDARIAGVLLSLAGAAILMGFITAEALYPGVFTTHTNTVSHLGASEPPNSVVLQPSAAIFDVTMLVTGAMILGGAWFAYRALRRKAVLVPTALLGVGTLGVGVFPLTHPAPHTLFVLTAFVAGGIAVVLSSRLTTAPFRYLWMVLGSVALAATALGLFFLEWAPVAELGEGGIERWIVYPIVLWLVAFGSYLMSTPTTRLPDERSRSVEERTIVDAGVRKVPVAPGPSALQRPAPDSYGQQGSTGHGGVRWPALFGGGGCACSLPTARRWAAPRASPS